MNFANSKSLIFGGALLLSAGVSSVAFAQSNSSDDSHANMTIRSLEGESTMSLSDMANAQETLARLQLLLEIERKLTEISQIREERGAGQAPASALGGTGFGAPTGGSSLGFTGNSPSFGQTPQMETFTPAPIVAEVEEPDSFDDEASFDDSFEDDVDFDMSEPTDKYVEEEEYVEVPNVVVERIFSAGGPLKAWIIGENGARIQVRQGDVIEGVRISNIDRHGVSLTAGGNTVTIPLQMSLSHSTDGLF